jgi:hypothetical protein
VTRFSCDKRLIFFNSAKNSFGKAWRRRKARPEKIEIFGSVFGEMTPQGAFQRFCKWRDPRDRARTARSSLLARRAAA